MSQERKSLVNKGCHPEPKAKDLAVALDLEEPGPAGIEIPGRS
jgi:hypothetical protein